MEICEDISSVVKETSALETFATDSFSRIEVFGIHAACSRSFSPRQFLILHSETDETTADRAAVDYYDDHLDRGKEKSER